jgi:DNA polymerase-3 subunit alpha
VAESAGVADNRNMPYAPFVHLRVQSCYSMLEGAMQPGAIAAAVRAGGFPAVAVADRNAMFGAMEFCDAAKDKGVQPITGALVAVARPDAARPQCDWLVLLAANDVGYANIVALVSHAHLSGDGTQTPHLKLADLDGRSDGLIALTAGPEGALARLLAEGQQAAAESYLDALQRLYGDRLYIELSRCDDPIETQAEPKLVDLAYARGLPLVATNPVLYPEAGFRAAHEIMLCIADGAYLETPDRRPSPPHAWLKPAEAMAELFADLPEAVANTLVVAQRCTAVTPKRDPILPSLAGDREGEAALLVERSRAGLDARLAKLGLKGSQQTPYRDRLEFELDVINKMGFGGYFLIVADFIQWAKGQGIPVGPGRGSGAGSVVAWALTITDLDPLKLGLLFERFLNPERVSMPDFDIDFCETRRDEVIRYVVERYGRAQVAQIITFGKLKARAVLKDVGRVLQMSYGQVDRLAKLVPSHPTDPWDLKRALNGVPELAREVNAEPGTKRLFDLAMKLEGLPRHSSTHAAGVVIGDRPLAELVPMYRDPRSDMGVTQFDMKWVEKAGLVKFDFLGLKTLSVLRRATELLAARGIDVDLDDLNWDDPAVYALLQRGDTVGVFQLESEGMRRTLAQVRPTNFGDIIALVSLYRPGPMDNIPTFGARKNGREPISYPHPALEATLKETYGVIVYQEQVMQAAQLLAGYSLGEADLLRRAMGKKIQAEMDAQRAGFVAGCKATHGIAETRANELFDLIDKFAGYGFNKSHAAAYALVAYQTAWLKAHYPVEFYAASMAFDIALTDKLSIFLDDMRRSRVACLPPCINKSGADFTTECIGLEIFAVRYALGALKGVGEKAMAAIVAEREANGPFASLDDFVARIDPKLLNKRQIECLAAAGAFDCLNDWPRAAVHGLADVILASANALHDAKVSGQGGLFGGATSDGSGDLARHRDRAGSWTVAQTMAAEKDAFGFFFAAHPTEQWRHVLEAKGVRSFAALCEAGGPLGGGRTSAMMAGLIEDSRWRTPQSGRGGRYLLLNLSDAGGGFVASAFDETAQAAAEAAAASGDPVLITAELNWRPGEDAPRVTVRALTPLADYARKSRTRLTLDIASPDAIAPLRALLDKAGEGRAEVHARVPVGSDRQAEIALGGAFAIDAELRERLARINGVAGVEVDVIVPA